MRTGRRVSHDLHQTLFYDWRYRVLQSISLVMGIGPIDTQRIDQPAFDKMVPAHDGNSAPITRLGQDYATSKAKLDQSRPLHAVQMVGDGRGSDPEPFSQPDGNRRQPFGSYGVENTKVILPDGADLFGRGSKGYLVGLRV